MNNDYIHKCQQWLLNELVNFYESNQIPLELSDKIKVFYKCISNSFDWYNYTKRDLRKLGFLCWEEDEESERNGVWFIPNWMFPIIPENITLYDKDGRSFEFHSSDVPREVMYGCLTFGVKMIEEDDGQY